MWWSPLTNSGERERVLEGLLRVGVAGCFIGHGAFGIIGKSAWLPYFAVMGISEEVAWILMPVVGTVDILVGITALVSPRPAVLAYAAFWGLWTALLRPLAGESIFETLERAGNYGVPLALLLLAAVRFEWSRQWLRPLAVDRLGPDRDRLLFRMLQVTTATLLLGHGGLALGGKPLLVGHLVAVGLPAAWVTSLGAAEVVLALAVLVRPFPGLLLFVFTWKVSTEVLFPVTGAPLWEFVERAGSYVAPLALWTLASRPLGEPSPERKLRERAVAGVLTALALGAAAASPVHTFALQGAQTGGDAPVLAALRGGGHLRVAMGSRTGDGATRAAWTSMIRRPSECCPPRDGGRRSGSVSWSGGWGCPLERYSPAPTLARRKRHASPSGGSRCGIPSAHGVPGTSRPCLSSSTIRRTWGPTACS